MMKFLLELSLCFLFLISFRQTSASDIQDNGGDESLRDFESNIRNLIDTFIDQLNKNQELFTESDFADFLKSINFDENEIESETETAINDDRLYFTNDQTPAISTVSLIKCYWHGLKFTCDFKLKVFRWRFHVSVIAEIHPPKAVSITVKFNDRRIWHKSIGDHDNELICYSTFPVKLCLVLDHVQLHSHYLHICFGFKIRLFYIRYNRRIGCIKRRFYANDLVDVKPIPAGLLNNLDLNLPNKIPNKFIDKMKKSSD